VAFCTSVSIAGCSAIIQPNTGLLDDDAGNAMSLEDSGTIDVDAGGVRHDAGEVDAWQMPGCPAPCTDGTVCDGVQCVCPFGACCPACAIDQLCVSADCIACGGGGEPCCDGGFCGAGSVCDGTTCQPCGGVDQACCDAGACDPGGICNGTTCDACGMDGQPCCDGGGCTGGATCQSDGLCHGGSMGCGNEGDPCCVGGTCNDASLFCSGGFPLGGGSCVHCGATGEHCCGSATGTLGHCDTGNVCTSSNFCQACGGAGERCCPGGSCRDGRTCHSGFCSG
jgi:hypothetical protein